MNSTTTNRSIRTTAGAAAAALLAVTAVGVAVLCTALFPARLPAPQDIQVVNVVFDSRPVIWAARLLLVSAAFVLAVGGAFVVASTIVRMRNGDWLRRAGPFEVSEASLADLKDEVHFWRSAAHDFRDAVDYLQEPFGDTGEPNQEVTSDE